MSHSFKYFPQHRQSTFTVLYMVYISYMFMVFYTVYLL